MKTVFTFGPEEIGKLMVEHLRELHNLPKDIFDEDFSYQEDGSIEVVFTADIEGTEEEPDCNNCKHEGVNLEDEPCDSCEDNSNFEEKEEDTEEDTEEDISKCPKCESSKLIVHSFYFCKDNEEKGPLPISAYPKCKDCEKLMNSKNLICKRCGHTIGKKTPVTPTKK